MLDDPMTAFFIMIAIVFTVGGLLLVGLTP
jgi:hypothetical protein